MHLSCRAVLFDSDGVLVDSDASVVRAWDRWSRQYGQNADSVIASVHGRRSADTIAALIAPDLQAQALIDIDTYEVDDAALVTAVPGAAALVADIPADARAVVTSAKRALLLARLAAADLPIPAVVVAAEDVPAGKPDPAGYLAAAASLRVPITSAIVIEDSVSGVDAARAAGVGAVIGVSERALATDADAVVEDLRSVRWTSGGLTIDDAAALRISPR
ncbi:HAD-IA family hydrolase [uncultured Jatrophihabitans sp.]|uniref:HAD-IA family hydrolase n=1 Tax=uncultured Jatrophihabitans sp. TaxID=1610747 RepID=UPI0035CC38BA